MHKLKETWLAVALLAAAGGAPAQDAFPSKPIKFVVCCTGYTEAVARVIAAELQDHLKQAIVVEPKPGANGMLGADYVVKSPPDGYTVFFGTNSTHAANQSLYRKLPYDYVKDFVPLSGISQGALLLAVAANVPAKSVAELTAMAKQQPGKLTFGAASSSARAGIELYKLISGADITYIPYKTNPQVVTDMLGGRIDMMFNDAGSLMPHVQAGKLRALAVSSATRSPAMPDVPTMQEAGVPDYSLSFWHGVWAPAGTPKPVADKLTEAFHWALAQPKVKAHITNAMAQPMPLTGPELLKFSQDEEKKWRKIVINSGMQVD
jgi:tripartite-type tricarboxylate transporter receptor subunit TctC